MTRKILLTVESARCRYPELISAFDEEDTLTFRLTAPRSAGLSSPLLCLADGSFLSEESETDGFLAEEEESSADSGARESACTGRVLHGESCGSGGGTDSAEKAPAGVEADNRGRNETRKKRVRRYLFSWEGSDYVTDRYTLTLSLRGLVGLYYASVLFDTGKGKMRFSYDPLHYAPLLTEASAPYEPFALTVYKSAYDTPSWFKGGLLYQIFVDRFSPGGEVVLRGDAILNPDWENGIPQYAPWRGAPLANNMFFGGTLWGVADKLDYLSSLGVTALYLSPVFEAYSNHKYDTGDYLVIDAMFGGEKAFSHLIAEAKKRSIGVILDGVFNHTGDDSRYFNKYGKYDSLGAFQSTESPYYPWYSFSDYPQSYRSWWGIDILPAVNTGERSYQEFVCGEEGVVRRYLKLGAAGWRLDVADELSEDLIRKIRTACKAEKEDALLLGEVWEDAAEKVAYGQRRHYFQGEELDGVMNYPLRNALIDYVMSGKAKPLFAVLKRLYAHYPKPASDAAMNLLGTHDTERILTRLSGVGENGRGPDELAVARLTPEERQLAIGRLRQAWFLLSMLPGVPCIYYGDEAGMEGYYDPFNRRTFPWGREDHELVAFYRTIGRIRREEKIFAEGWFRLIENLPEGVLAFYRFDDETTYLAAVNLSEKNLLLPFSGLELLSGKRIKQRLLLKKQNFCLIKREI